MHGRERAATETPHSIFVHILKWLVENKRGCRSAIKMIEESESYLTTRGLGNSMCLSFPERLKSEMITGYKYFHWEKYHRGGDGSTEKKITGSSSCNARPTMFVF